MGPRARAGPLADRSGSQSLWLRGPGVLELLFFLLAGWASAQGVLVPTHWWVRLVPRLVLAHWWVELGPRVSDRRALGDPGLVLHNGVWDWVLGPPVGRAGTWGDCGLRGS